MTHLIIWPFIYTSLESSLRILANKGKHGIQETVTLAQKRNEEKYQDPSFAEDL